MQLKTEGMVLLDRQMEGEDRLFIILTKELGVISAFGRGTRQMKRRMTSATEPLTHSSFLLFKNKERYILDGAETLHLFFNLRTDLEKLSLAMYFAQLMQELAPKEEPAGEYLRLMLNTLYLLDTGKRAPGFLKPVLELRVASMSGYMPDLIACRDCGEYLPPLMYLDMLRGSLICENCLGQQRQGSGMYAPMNPGVLTALRHVALVDMEKLFQFSLPEQAFQQFSRICEQYLLSTTERTFTSLEYWKALYPAEPPENTLKE